MSASWYISFSHDDDDNDNIFFNNAILPFHQVKLAVILHRRYEEFCDGLCAGIKSSLLGPLPSLEEDPDAGKKKRIQIRFVIELYQAGLFTDEEFFCQLLRNILGKSRMKYGNNL